MKTVYAVYSQYYPEYKYEPHLESLWTTQELAEKEKERLRPEYDRVYIEEFYLDSEQLNDSDF